MRPVIFWFRRDLRLSDNAALSAAAETGQPIVPVYIVDGQDVVATFTMFSDLIAKVRDGAGPQYVDVRTYRFKGHSMSDPVSGTYRSKDEVDSQVETRDPIKIHRDRLFDAGLLTQEELEKMDEEVRQVCQEAADFADASPLPDPSTLYDHVYKEMDVHGRLFLDATGGSRG